MNASSMRHSARPARIAAHAIWRPRFNRQGHTLAVLENRTDYSVCEYRKRMSSSIGLHYLGLDPEDGYDKEARLPNAFISAITRVVAYNAAFQAGCAAFKRARPLSPRLPPDDKRILMDLQQWADLVVCELVKTWFGFPDDTVMRKGGAAEASPDLPCCPDDFRVASLYIFGPQPTDVLSAFAQRRGRLVESAARAFAHARSETPPGDRNNDVLIDRLLNEKIPAR